MSLEHRLQTIHQRLSDAVECNAAVIQTRIQYFVYVKYQQISVAVRATVIAKMCFLHD